MKGAHVGALMWIPICFFILMLAIHAARLWPCLTWYKMKRAHLGALMWIPIWFLHPNAGNPCCSTVTMSYLIQNERSTHTLELSCGSQSGFFILMLAIHAARLWPCLTWYKMKRAHLGALLWIPIWFLHTNASNPCCSTVTMSYLIQNEKSTPWSSLVDPNLVSSS